MDSQEINFIEASYVESNLPILIGVIIFFVALLVFIIALIKQKDTVIEVALMAMISIGMILIMVLILNTVLGPLAKTHTTAKESTHLTTDEFQKLNYDHGVMTDIIKDHGFEGWAKYVEENSFYPISEYELSEKITPYMTNDQETLDQIYLYKSNGNCNQYYKITDIHQTPKDSFGNSYWNGKVTIEPYQEICSEK